MLCPWKSMAVSVEKGAKLLRIIELRSVSVVSVPQRVFVCLSVFLCLSLSVCVKAQRLIHGVRPVLYDGHMDTQSIKGANSLFPCSFAVSVATDTHGHHGHGGYAPQEDHNA